MTREEDAVIASALRNGMTARELATELGLEVADVRAAAAREITRWESNR